VSIEIAHKNTIQYCTKLLFLTKILLNGFSYTICDFATNKTEKKYEVSQTSNPTLNCHITDNIRLPNGDTKKSRIGLLHRNQFTEGIQLT
jgi:hypothetical protein